MTSASRPGHFAIRVPAAAFDQPAPASGEIPSFDAIYASHFGFLHRAARGFGVSASAVEDVLQDVFLVVHRRLPELRPGGSVRAWVLRILINVVREQRRTYRRKGGHASLSDEGSVVDEVARSPHERVEMAQAAELLESILDGMEEERREVFVLAEIEGVPVQEIAEATGANPNTTHSRLRLARKDYEAAVTRLRARLGRVPGGRP